MGLSVLEISACRDRPTELTFDSVLTLPMFMSLGNLFSLAFAQISPNNEDDVLVSQAVSSSSADNHPQQFSLPCQVISTLKQIRVSAGGVAERVVIIPSLAPLFVNPEHFPQIKIQQMEYWQEKCNKLERIVISSMRGMTFALSFHENGQFLSCACEDRVHRLFFVQPVPTNDPPQSTLDRTQNTIIYSECPSNPEFSPKYSATLVSTSSDHAGRVWDSTLAITPTMVLSFSVSQDGKLRVWKTPRIDDTHFSETTTLLCENQAHFPKHAWRVSVSRIPKTTLDGILAETRDGNELESIQCVTGGNDGSVCLHRFITAVPRVASTFYGTISTTEIHPEKTLAQSDDLSPNTTKDSQPTSNALLKPVRRTSVGKTDEYMIKSCGVCFAGEGMFCGTKDGGILFRSVPPFSSQHHRNANKQLVLGWGNTSSVSPISAFPDQQPSAVNSTQSGQWMLVRSSANTETNTVGISGFGFSSRTKETRLDVAKTEWQFAFVGLTNGTLEVLGLPPSKEQSLSKNETEKESREGWCLIGSISLQNGTIERIGVAMEERMENGWTCVLYSFERAGKNQRGKINVVRATINTSLPSPHLSIHRLCSCLAPSSSVIIASSLYSLPSQPPVLFGGDLAGTLTAFVLPRTLLQDLSPNHPFEQIEPTLVIPNLHNGHSIVVVDQLPLHSPSSSDIRRLTPTIFTAATNGTICEIAVHVNEYPSNTSVSLALLPLYIASVEDKLTQPALLFVDDTNQLRVVGWKHKTMIVTGISTERIEPFEISKIRSITISLKPTQSSKTLPSISHLSLACGESIIRNSFTTDRPPSSDVVVESGGASVTSDSVLADIAVGCGTNEMERTLVHLFVSRGSVEMLHVGVGYSKATKEEMNQNRVVLLPPNHGTETHSCVVLGGDGGKQQEERRLVNVSGGEDGRIVFTQLSLRPSLSTRREQTFQSLSYQTRQSSSLFILTPSPTSVQLDRIMFAVHIHPSSIHSVSTIALPHQTHISLFTSRMARTPDVHSSHSLVLACGSADLISLWMVDTSFQKSPQSPFITPLLLSFSTITRREWKHTDQGASLVDRSLAVQFRLLSSSLLLFNSLILCAIGSSEGIVFLGSISLHGESEVSEKDGKMEETIRHIHVFDCIDITKENQTQLNHPPSSESHQNCAASGAILCVELVICGIGNNQKVFAVFGGTAGNVFVVDVTDSIRKEEQRTTRPISTEQQKETVEHVRMGNKTKRPFTASKLCFDEPTTQTTRFCGVISNAHDCGVNCISIVHSTQTHLENEKLILGTGGDDGCVGLLVISITPDSLVLDTQYRSMGHASGVRGVVWVAPHSDSSLVPTLHQKSSLVSVSTDETLRTWSIDDDGSSLVPVDGAPVRLGEIGGVCAYPSIGIGNGNLVCVFGQGLEWFVLNHPS
ncbi:hypothetical protein BLNAU_8398 [Blattamonas nauphoetae]|uniref:Uncharacterized protein n=1 Tax=Blattamonas nauphoetae TaxID=2049346 RepID=A0ABQ9XYK6_9EUKA|nr:hypothetical protein BLNAU_8398 [Blattamonas nauphoetae]